MRTSARLAGIVVGTALALTGGAVAADATQATPTLVFSPKPDNWGYPHIVDYGVTHGCLNLPGVYRSAINNTNNAQWFWSGYNCSGSRVMSRPGWNSSNITVRSVSHT